MGYDCELEGRLSFNKPVEKEMIDYLNRYSEFRHVKLNVAKLKKVYPDWKDLCYKGELGIHGEFFAPGGYGVKDNSVVIDGDNCPERVPYLHSPYVVTEDGLYLECNSGSAYSFLGWLAYYIKVFFEPNGLVLNGTMEYEGCGDSGTVEVTDNHISYSGPAVADSYRRYYNPSVVGYTEPYGRLDGGEDDIDLDEYYEANNALMESELYKNMVESDAFVEAVIVLDKEQAALEDYEKLAEMIASYKYINGVFSISKFRKNMKCHTCSGESILMKKGEFALFVKCRYADRIVLDGAKLLIPDDYSAACGEIKDVKKYELCPSDEFTYIFEDYAYKRQKTVYDLGFFSIVIYCAMKIHFSEAEEYAHAFLAGDGSCFGQWNDGPDEREDIYMGCDQYFGKLKQYGMKLESLLPDAFKHIISGELKITEDRIESLWYGEDDLKLSNDEKHSVLGYPYTKYVEEVTLACVDSDGAGRIVAEQRNEDGYIFRTAYSFDESTRKIIDECCEEIYYDSLWDYAEKFA